MGSLFTLVVPSQGSKNEVCQATYDKAAAPKDQAPVRAGGRSQERRARAQGRRRTSHARRGRQERGRSIQGTGGGSEGDPSPVSGGARDTPGGTGAAPTRLRGSAGRGRGGPSRHDRFGCRDGGCPARHARADEVPRGGAAHTPRDRRSSTLNGVVTKLRLKPPCDEERPVRESS